MPETRTIANVGRLHLESGLDLERRPLTKVGYGATISQIGRYLTCPNPAYRSQAP